jgi:hypothetical protein
VCVCVEHPHRWGREPQGTSPLSFPPPNPHLPEPDQAGRRTPFQGALTRIFRAEASSLRSSFRHGRFPFHSALARKGGILRMQNRKVGPRPDEGIPFPPEWRGRRNRRTPPPLRGKRPAQRKAKPQRLNDKGEGYARHQNPQEQRHHSRQHR